MPNINKNDLEEMRALSEYYISLMVAIIDKARKDYIDACRESWRDSEDAIEIRQDIIEFVNSKWFRMFSDVRAEDFLRSAEAEAIRKDKKKMQKEYKEDNREEKKAYAKNDNGEKKKDYRK